MMMRMKEMMKTKKNEEKEAMGKGKEDMREENKRKRKRRRRNLSRLILCHSQLNLEQNISDICRTVLPNEDEHCSGNK